MTDVDIPPPEAMAPAPVSAERTLDYVWGEDAAVVVRAVAPDGRALVSSADPSDFDADRLTFRATDTVSLWTAEGLAPLGGSDALLPEEPHRQVVDATFTDAGVAWAETSRTDVHLWEWRLFGDDLTGAGPRLLARSEDAAPATDLTFGSGGSLLAAVGDRVAWDMTYEGEDGTLHTALVSVPVSGGPARTEGELVAMPSGTPDGWVTLRLAAAADGGHETAPYRAVGVGLVAPGGHVTPLARFAAEEDWAVDRLTADGPLYSWATTEEVYVATVDGAVAHRLRHGPGLTVDPSSLAVCGDRVVWAAMEGGAETSTVYVFDPGSGRSRVLATEAVGGGVTCGGRHVAWTEGDVRGDREIRTVTLARLG